MCIDDEVNLLTLYERELTDSGYEVVSCSGVESALLALAAQPVDLVVLDIKLAEEDGLQLLEQIRRQHRDLPVLLHTAYPAYKQDFHSWLADDYLVKSADLTPLKTKIRELLEI
jgi:DNA-binding response OmpR family regulator